MSESQSADRIALNAALDHSARQDDTIKHLDKCVQAQSEEIRQLRRKLQRAQNEPIRPEVFREATEPEETTMDLQDAQYLNHAWAIKCFGENVVNDKRERVKRFLEEAIELFQAAGGTADDADDLLAYVFGRTKGEPTQEVGGVLVTLLVLCSTAGISAAGALQLEMSRINDPVFMERSRKKQVSKEIAGIGNAKGVPRCKHERLTEEGICRTCGEDCRGIL